MHVCNGVNCYYSITGHVLQWDKLYYEKLQYSIAAYSSMHAQR